MPGRGAVVRLSAEAFEARDFPQQLALKSFSHCDEVRCRRHEAVVVDRRRDVVQQLGLSLELDTQIVEQGEVGRNSDAQAALT
eukprot:COSAG04_NODE_649_length_11584_cov_241.553069_3_plen_83_part_00